MNRLVIIGASGHGAVISDTALELGYTDIVFLDDDLSIKEHAGYPCVGGSAQLTEARRYPEEGADYVVAIGNPAIRERIRCSIAAAEEALAVKDNEVSLIHPDSVIGRNVSIGCGTVVMAGTVINHGASIGEGCIINTGSSVDHDCILGDQVHISVGAHVAGTVIIGDRTWIGAGATVSNNVNICDDCMIGAGAVVVKNIGTPGTYTGVPAALR